MTKPDFYITLNEENPDYRKYCKMTKRGETVLFSSPSISPDRDLDFFIATCVYKRKEKIGFVYDSNR